MNKIKISILDLGGRDNKNSVQTINNIIELAIEADKLNFNRFWLSEHHYHNSLHPYNNPDILLSLIAGYTEKIRVGSGGALVGYYPPYLLACNYKLMNNLFDNRIDLGLSKGRPGNIDLHNYLCTDYKDHFELFADNLDSICDLFHNEHLNFSEKKIVIPPFAGMIPSLWYLSNSYSDLDVAIKRKLNYCRSLFHGLDLLNKNYEKDKILKFKDEFQDKNKFTPEIAIAIAISFKDSKIKLEKKERKNINRKEALKIISVSIESLFELLSEYQVLYGIDEFVLYNTEPNNQVLIEDLSIISEKFNL